MTAGFVAVGLAAPIALATVLVCRLLTLWMPIGPGCITLRRLKASAEIQEDRSAREPLGTAGDVG